MINISSYINNSIIQEEGDYNLKRFSSKELKDMTPEERERAKIHNKRVEDLRIQAKTPKAHAPEKGWFGNIPKSEAKKYRKSKIEQSKFNLGGKEKAKKTKVDWAMLNDSELKNKSAKAKNLERDIQKDIKGSKSWRDFLRVKSSEDKGVRSGIASSLGHTGALRTPTTALGTAALTAGAILAAKKLWKKYKENRRL